MNVVRTIEVFGTFMELNEERKKEEIQKAIDNRELDFIIELDLADFLTEYIETQGLELRNLYYSLSYSQGDGVSFDIDTLDLETLLGEDVEQFKDLVTAYNHGDLDVRISQSAVCRYYHWNSMDVYLELSDLREGDFDGEYLDKFEDLINDKIEEVSRKAERVGYKFMEDLYEEDYVRDFLEGGDVEYLIHSRTEVLG